MLIVFASFMSFYYQFVFLQDSIAPWFNRIYIYLCHVGLQPKEEQTFANNTPPGAKLGLCRSTIYSKFFIGGPSNFLKFSQIFSNFLKFSQIFQIFSNFPLHTSVWLGLRSGAAKVRQSRCVRPPESSSSSSTQYRVEIVL